MLTSVHTTLWAPQCKGLDSKDSNGKSDPFLIFKIGDEVLKTPVIHEELNPTWPRFRRSIISMTQARSIGELQEVNWVVECHDWDKLGKPNLIGTAQIPLRDLLKDQAIFTFNLIRPVTKKAMNKDEVAGVITFYCRCQIISHMSITLPNIVGKTLLNISPCSQLHPSVKVQLALLPPPARRISDPVPKTPVTPSAAPDAAPIMENLSISPKTPPQTPVKAAPPNPSPSKPGVVVRRRNLDSGLSERNVLCVAAESPVCEMAGSPMWSIPSSLSLPVTARDVLRLAIVIEVIHNENFCGSMSIGHAILELSAVLPTNAFLHGAWVETKTVNIRTPLAGPAGEMTLSLRFDDIPVTSSPPSQTQHNDKLFWNGTEIIEKEDAELLLDHGNDAQLEMASEFDSLEGGLEDDVPIDIS